MLTNIHKMLSDRNSFGFDVVFTPVDVVFGLEPGGAADP